MTVPVSLSTLQLFYGDDCLAKFSKELNLSEQLIKNTICYFYDEESQTSKTILDLSEFAKDEGEFGLPDDPVDALKWAYRFMVVEQVLLPYYQQGDESISFFIERKESFSHGDYIECLPMGPPYDQRFVNQKILLCCLNGRYKLFLEKVKPRKKCFPSMKTITFAELSALDIEKLNIAGIDVGFTESPLNKNNR